MDRKKFAKVTIILGVLLIVIGVSYAFFNYTRTGVSNVIKVGRISFNSNQTNTITLLDAFPIDSSEVLTSDKVGTATITISGDTTYDEGVEYLLTVSNLTNTVGTKEIPIDVVVTASGIGDDDTDYFDNRGGDSSIYKVLSSGTISNNKQLLAGYITKGATGVNGLVTIKAYLDKNKIAISDTYDGTESDNMGTTNEWVAGRTILTTTEWNNLQTNGVSFQVKVEANEGVWVEDYRGYKKVQNSILAKQNAATNSCNPVWIDDNGTANDESDDITYFSGTNDCVDMNYVWYSGKLWRITAIYPDGAMKLITADNITTILWGSDVEYDGSWVYQWLNEDFYDTLVNPNNIIDSSTWNYSEDGNSTPVRPDTIATQKTKTAPVGLLNAYEYYNSYRCIGSAACTGSSYGTGYLNIGYYWWLITPYFTSYVHYVGYSGHLNSGGSPSNNAYGVRPSINLKSGLEFAGEGSKTSPYKIVGDKEDAVNNTTLLSSRSVGEYVKFDNDLYRIVDTTEGITKLTKVDYLRDSGTVITKNLSSTVYFGKSTNTQTDTYWDYYLNNTWYNSISTTYKNMLVDGTYYLGLYPNNTNYKATLCKDADLNSVTTANCTKYTSSDTDKTWTGKVGLPRAGEMFLSQLGSGYSTSSNMWILTPYSASDVRRVRSNDDLGNSSPSSSADGVRPSINLKSGIEITGGTGYVGGDTNSPFEISE